MSVLEVDILPLTRQGISRENKIFGAAAVRKSNLELVIAGTNEEVINSLFHGEVWCLNGFDNFYYFFGYEDSRDEFAIPQDLIILGEVFGCTDGNYAEGNAYWSGHHITDMIEAAGDPVRSRLRKRAAALKSAYAGLSDCHQRLKHVQPIPFK